MTTDVTSTEERMDVRRLKYYCTIVEQGQISRAAKLLHVSQSPLCQRLKELEDELGVPLILREKRRWEVTDAGRVLYREAKGILEGLENIRELVKDSERSVAGEVSIGVSPTCDEIVLTAVASLSRRYPMLRFHLRLDDSSVIEQCVASGELDLGVALLPLSGQACELRRMRPMGLRLVFDPTLGYVSKGVATIPDLQGVPLLLFKRNEGGGVHARLMQVMQEHGVSPRVVLEIENTRELLRLLELGMPAAALLPSAVVPDSVKSRFTVLPVVADNLTATPSLIVKKGRYLTRCVREVMGEILSQAGLPESSASQV